jgi:hypothetical protein
VINPHKPSQTVINWPLLKPAPKFPDCQRTSSRKHTIHYCMISWEIKGDCENFFRRFTANVI